MTSMAHRDRSIPASQEFERLARRAQFRDRIAIPVTAAPESLFRAACEVTLREMPLARMMGAIRYFPSRVARNAPASDLDTPFLWLLMDGGTLVLHVEPPREIITGSAGQLHRLMDQAPVRFASHNAFETFDEPDHEKLFMSLRIAPRDQGEGCWLILEHATEALSARVERKFRRYWRVIRPAGAFVTMQLLNAIARRARVVEDNRKHAA